MALPTPQSEPPRKPPKSAVPFEALLLGGGIILFLAMVVEMHLSLSSGQLLPPFVAALAGGMLLWPMRRRRAARQVLVTGAVLLTLWMLFLLRVVLLPFVVVFVLAFLFNPLVTRLDARFGVPRYMSSLAVMAVILGLASLFVLILVPNLLREIGTLAERAVEAADGLRDWMDASPFVARLVQVGLIDPETFFSAEGLDQGEGGAAGLTDLIREALGFAGSVFGIITLLAVVPVALFFTLKDYPSIIRQLVDLMPTFGGRRDYLVQISRVVGGYLRGLIIISSITAFNVSIALLLFDVPFALLIGLLAGLMNMIPTLGAIITGIVGVLVAVLFGDPWFWTAVTVAAVIFGQGLLEQSLLTPKIMSDQVGLHPIVILLSLFIFGALFGLLGLLIAVPVTALIIIAYRSRRDDLKLELSPDARLKRDLADRVFRRFRTRPAEDPEM